MKTYNSMYIGLCINNNDPEERGRVQVFVPHIMPSLIESLSGEEDIEITCVGDNMVNGLNGKVLDRLKTILPWSEAASPILCGSSPGLLVRDENGKAILNQSPVTQGTSYSSSSATPQAQTTTDSSGLPAAAEAGPQPNKNPLETSQLPDTAAQAAPLKGELSSNILNNGKQVNPLSFRDDIYNYILATNPNFLRNLPPGSTELGMLQEGINGVTREQAARSVADVITKMGGIESGFSISSSNTKDPGGSFGILQYSAAHANQFYGKQNGINVTPELLNSDPGIGGRAAVGMLQNLSNRNVSVFNGLNRKGFGGIFAARTMNLLAANKDLTLEQSLAVGAELKDYKNLTKIGGTNSQYTNTSETINQLASQANIVSNPDKGGRTPIINTNNMSKGLFTYPAVGAMLWVFFREGNPLFPVYFAASYGKSEWAAAYGNNSPAPGNPGENNPPGVVTHSTVYNTGAGGFRTEQVIDHNNIENNKSNFSIFGPGSNQIHLTDGAAYFYFRDYLRHQVEGPLYESVLGTHESWIQGDSNSVFLGARKVITGTLTEESINAAQELQKLMNEIQAPLSKSVT